MVAAEESLRVLSLIPGRMRVHLSGWDGSDRERIEARFRQIEGVDQVEANPRTGNILIHFEPRLVSEKSLLRELHQVQSRFVANGNRISPHLPLDAAHSTIIRVGVRGVLGHAVVDSLWFGAGYLGKFVGLPLAWLGPLHVLMDIAVWTYAVRSGTRASHGQTQETKAERSTQVGRSLALRTPVDASPA